MMIEFDKDTQKRVRIVHHDLRAEVNEMLSADLGNFDYIVLVNKICYALLDVDCFLLTSIEKFKLSTRSSHSIVPRS